MYAKVAPKNGLASMVLELSVKKKFPFPFVTFVLVLPYPHGLKGHLSPFCAFAAV